MEDFAIIVLMIVVVILLMYRTQSSYTSDQIRALGSSIPIGQGVSSAIFDILLNELKGMSVVDSVNALISQLNANGANPPLVPYASDDAIKTMFDTAYKNTESGLTRTDKAVLRAFSQVSWEMAMLPWGQVAGLPALAYTADGVPVWAADMLAQTGLNVNSSMQKVIETAKKFGGGQSQDMILAVNSLLPANATPFASVDDYVARIRATLSPGSTTADPAILWLAKFISIGPLYIAWVAENKWQLDPNGFQFRPLKEGEGGNAVSMPAPGPGGGNAVEIAIGAPGPVSFTPGQPLK